MNHPEWRPYWQPDATNCALCNESFGYFKIGKHHCRKCGKIVCGKCCEKLKYVDSYFSEVKICNRCYNQTK